MADYDVGPDVSGFAAALMQSRRQFRGRNLGPSFGPKEMFSGYAVAQTPTTVPLPASPGFVLSPWPMATANTMPTPRCVTPRKRSLPQSGGSDGTSGNSEKTGSNPFFTPPKNHSDPASSTSTTPSMSGLNLSTSPAATPRTPSRVTPSPQFSFSLSQPPRSALTATKSHSMPLSCAPQSQKKTVGSGKYAGMSPSQLAILLGQNEGAVLMLDLRPQSAFIHQGHLRDSINLCAPSTLLRRPAYTLAKLASMLPSPMDEQRLARALQDAEDGELTHVVVFDQDSPILPSESPLNSVLLKFEKAGFKGTCGWLVGGFNAVIECPNLDDYRTNDSLSASPETSSVESFPSLKRTESESSTGSTSSATGSSVSGGLKFQGLPATAFTASSTQQHLLGVSLPNTRESGKNSASLSRRSTLDSRSSSMSNSEGVRVTCNPFFDSIRQNAEGLCWRRSIERLDPIKLSPGLKGKRRSDKMPAFLRTFVNASPHERALRAAREFFELEAMEQKRLQDVMYWHANNQTDADAYHPLSISAGVEKGSLNRYKHIFPFEHARCRLKRGNGASCDYVNASHVTFDGPIANKKYIASQAPTEAAIPDFWQLCLQEEVSVIIMLTELREGGREKSSKYFAAGKYDNITVDIISQDVKSPDAPAQSGGFFTPVAAHDSAQEPAIIRRTLRVTNSSGSSRIIQHLQFGQWPDFGIPPSTDVILDLIDDANKSNKLLSKENGGEAGPLLVHCSAGVGRTGCFILIDVMQYALRNNLSMVEAMDVDDNTDYSAEPLSPGSRIQQLAKRETPAVARADPIFALVDEMRQQRMSMVANAAQYRYCYKAIIRAYNDRL